MIRIEFKNGKQIIKEICEHCGEVARNLHVSDITVLKPNDNRRIRINNSEGKPIDVKTREHKIREMTQSFIDKGLLDETEAIEFRTTKKLKYGIRPDAMCSEYIDNVAGVPASFCYKTDNAKFQAKTSGSTTFRQKLEAESEKLSNERGRKVGIDRKGNIIRMKSEKNLDEADSAVKYHGQFKESWFRALKPDIQKSYLEKVQDCSAIQKQFGADACKSGEVMSQFRNVDEFKTYMDRNCR